VVCSGLLQLGHGVLTRRHGHSDDARAVCGLDVARRVAHDEDAAGVEPGAAEAEVAEAGIALGRALAGPLRADSASGFGFASMTSAEALASVVLEISSLAGKARLPGRLVHSLVTL